MSQPKVLIIVHKGVAEYLTLGDVEVEIIDEDNIDAGDSRVVLAPEWEPLLKGIYKLPNSRYVCIAVTDNTPGVK